MQPGDLMPGAPRAERLHPGRGGEAPAASPSPARRPRWLGCAIGFSSPVVRCTLPGKGSSRAGPPGRPGRCVLGEGAGRGGQGAPGMESAHADRQLDVFCRLIENCKAEETEAKCYVTHFHYRCEVI